jgi:WD40 repeat protein
MLAPFFGSVTLADSQTCLPVAASYADQFARRSGGDVRCFNDTTGKVLWAHDYEVAYEDWAFDPKQEIGPSPRRSSGMIRCTRWGESHPMTATHSAWHPDGQTLATCCDDHRIRLWDVTTGHLLRVLVQPSTNVFGVALNKYTVGARITGLP